MGKIRAIRGFVAWSVCQDRTEDGKDAGDFLLDMD